MAECIWDQRLFYTQEIPYWHLSVIAVAALSKTPYPYCLVPRKGLKAVGPLDVTLPALSVVKSSALAVPNLFFNCEKVFLLPWVYCPKVVVDNELPYLFCVSFLCSPSLENITKGPKGMSRPHVLASTAQTGASILLRIFTYFPCYRPSCRAFNFMHFQTSVIRLVDRFTWAHLFGIILQINRIPN